MADIDIDPFGEHESRTEEPTDEHIPLDLITQGRSSIWDYSGVHKTTLRAHGNQNGESKKHHSEENLIELNS